ncbi:hypothetical protein [Alkalicoccus chagannorensis]|uniref:hypothetical protein n=1 Tax=Alkalicoccus chagannorensis TaxID=427072 RepID=UPI00041D541E|nr:hypothetical protein [Alkalicoccus chagannorensis]
MKGNWTVVLLPLAVMAGLFIFGYFTLQENTAEMTNADLQEEMMLEMQEQQLEWEWETQPQDGVIGDNYIEIVTEDTELVDDLSVALYYANEAIESEHEVFLTEDGVAAAYPTYIDNEITAGAIGEAVWEQSGVESVRMYHTWAQAEPEEGADLAEELEDQISGYYWVQEAE